MDRPSGKTQHPIISDFAGDPEMVELVELFVGELPARIRALESAWNERRIQNLSRLAHQLKGSCSGYGFPDIGSAAGSLEERLRQAADADASASLSRVATEFRTLVDLCMRACRPSS